MLGIRFFASCIWPHWHWHEVNEPWLLQVFCESNGCWCGNKPSTKKYLKLTLFPNISERNLKQTNFKQKLYQTVSEEASLTKKPIKRNLYQKQFQQKSPQPFFCRKTGKLKLMTFSNMFSADCIRSEFCQVVFVPMTALNFLVEIFLHIFGRDFSSGIFFVEIFLRILFGRQMSPKILFGRDVFFALQNVSSELPWFFLSNSGRNIVWKKNYGELFFHLFFRLDLSSDYVW